MSTVHQVAVSGFGEGTNDVYDRARPSYPSDALSFIHSTIASTPLAAKEDGWRIIEPGAGTGIFSRLLISPPLSRSPAAGEYPSFPITALVGVEPSAGMRNAWDRGLDKLDDKDKSGRTLASVQGSFDDFANVHKFGITKADSSDGVGAGVGVGVGAHAVIIAQAWHWCPDHEKALREIASYLPPGSPLILIWNLEGFSPKWQADIRTAYQRYDLGTPQYYKGWWKAMFETAAYAQLFEEKEEWHTTWSVGLTEDQASGCWFVVVVLIERQFSKSYLTSAHLSAEDREVLEAELRRIIQGGAGGKEWVDEANGIFKYQYDTDVVVLRRKT